MFKYNVTYKPLRAGYSVKTLFLDSFYNQLYVHVTIINKISKYLNIYEVLDTYDIMLNIGAIVPLLYNAWFIQTLNSYL